ncbi:putative basic proline-rich protein-like [Iris pallida]|uniref:Basic proline-rich protein-like n=1 Tax=Iris pallida TaxID=29817 RepID=A0AAX6GJB3_IRIPA|nr:putative basic proline-rich protein-like [Iris pallida]
MATSSSTSPTPEAEAAAAPAPPSSSSPTSSPDKPPASPHLSRPPLPFTVPPSSPTPTSSSPPVPSSSPTIAPPAPGPSSTTAPPLWPSPETPTASSASMATPPTSELSISHPPAYARDRCKCLASAVRTFHPLQRPRPPPRRPRRRAPAAPLRPPVSASCTPEGRCFQIGPGRVEVGGSRELGGLVSFRRCSGQLRCGVPRSREVGRKEQLRVRDRAWMRRLGACPDGRRSPVYHLRAEYDDPCVAFPCLGLP